MRIKQVDLSIQEVLNEVVLIIEAQDLSVRELKNELKELDDRGELSEILTDICFEIVGNKFEDEDGYNYDWIETEDELWKHINNELNREYSVFSVCEEDEEAVIYNHIVLSDLINCLNK